MTTSPLHVIFGAGILGQTIAKGLARDGARVRLVTRKGTLLSGGEAAAADLMDPASATTAAQGADVIYFCAAPPYQDWVRSFPQMQEGAIAAARKTGAVLVAAENLYGYGVAGQLTENLPLAATTRKGRIRARMSERLFQAHAGGEIQSVSGRASDFFGPSVLQSAVGDRFWPALLKGRPVNWFGDPDRLHSFTYLLDFAQALIRLGQAPDAWGRAWHVPTVAPISLRAFATEAARIAKAPAPIIRRTPRLMLRLLGLAIPAAGEMVELEYMFSNDFVIRDEAWSTRFGINATILTEALAQTIGAWRDEQPGGAGPATSAAVLKVS